MDEQNMVVDFGKVKADIGGWIDGNLDHRMILRRDDPLAAFLNEHNEPYFLMDEAPTAENIARCIFEAAQRLGYPVVAVNLWETSTSVATYGK